MIYGGGRHRGQARSAEGNYRSPQHWDPVTWAPQARPLAHRAFEVELIVGALGDPFRPAIVLTYIKQAPIGMLHRILRRRFRVEDDPQNVLAEARHRIAAALVHGGPMQVA